jgi:hypothetical protein
VRTRMVEHNRELESVRGHYEQIEDEKEELEIKNKEMELKIFLLEEQVRGEGDEPITQLPQALLPDHSAELEGMRKKLSRATKALEVQPPRRPAAAVHSRASDCWPAGRLPPALCSPVGGWPALHAPAVRGASRALRLQPPGGGGGGGSAARIMASGGVGVGRARRPAAFTGGCPRWVSIMWGAYLHLHLHCDAEVCSLHPPLPRRWTSRSVTCRSSWTSCWGRSKLRAAASRGRGGLWAMTPHHERWSRYRGSLVRARLGGEPAILE